MEELLYDKEAKEGSIFSSQEGEEDMQDVDALLQSEKSKMTSYQQRTMEKSGREYSDQLEEFKVVKEDIESKYEEESFEEVKTSLSSPSKRVQSANLDNTVRFSPVNEKKNSPRPKSSPAGKVKSTKYDDNKLSSVPISPNEKAEPKQLFSPSGKESFVESKNKVGDPPRTPPRSASAPSTRSFPYATPGYTGSPTKSAGRMRLEQVLEDIHNRKSVGKYVTGKMLSFKNVLSTGQVTRHQRWTYLEDGVKAEATPPFSMELQHHSVSDYRCFRPTSANKRLMPSKDRDTSEFLLPGQTMRDELQLYDGKKLRHIMHECMAKAMTKVENCFIMWGENVARANLGQQERLEEIHKGEMKELVIYFQNYKPNQFMKNLLDETKYPQHVHGKHIMVTEEDKDYVNRQLASQAQHSENRMHILRTHLKNRHRDELQAIKENTRAPLELLNRIRHTQEEVLEETAKKVINKIIHAEKIVKTIHDSRDPAVLLRAQKAEKHCMTMARAGIKRIEQTAEGMDNVFKGGDDGAP